MGWTHSPFYIFFFLLCIIDNISTFYWYVPRKSFKFFFFLHSSAVFYSVGWSRESIKMRAALYSFYRYLVPLFFNPLRGYIRRIYVWWKKKESLSSPRRGRHSILNRICRPGEPHQSTVNVDHITFVNKNSLTLALALSYPPLKSKSRHSLSRHNMSLFFCLLLCCCWIIFLGRWKKKKSSSVFSTSLFASYVCVCVCPNVCRYYIVSHAASCLVAEIRGVYTLSYIRNNPDV